MSKGVPLLQVRINGSRPLCFLLDSGSTRMILDSALLAELHLTRFGSASITGLSGEIIPVGRVRGDVTVSVADVASEEHTFYAIDLSAASASIGQHIDGILGCEFFARFVVVIDSGRSEVFLERRRN